MKNLKKTKNMTKAHSMTRKAVIAAVLAATLLTGCGKNRTATVQDMRDLNTVQNYADRTAINANKYKGEISASGNARKSKKMISACHSVDSGNDYDYDNAYSAPATSTVTMENSTNGAMPDYMKEAPDDTSNTVSDTTTTDSSDDTDNSKTAAESTVSAKKSEKKGDTGLVATQLSTKELHSKIIYQGSLDMESDTYTKTKAAIKNLIEKHNGFVQDSQEGDNIYTGDYDSGYVYTDDGETYRKAASSEKKAEKERVLTGKQWYFTAKIPAENFQKFMDDMEKSGGKVVAVNMSSADLTKTYSDNADKLKVLKIEEEHFENMLKKATSTSDMMDIEDRLADVRSNIAELTNKNGDIDYDSAYSSVSILLSETKEVKPVKEEKEIKKDNPGTWLTDSMGGFGKFLATLLEVIIYLFPYALLVTFIVLLVKKIKKHKAEKEEQELQEIKRMAKEAPASMNRRKNNPIPVNSAGTERKIRRQTESKEEKQIKDTDINRSDKKEDKENKDND